MHSIELLVRQHRDVKLLFESLRRAGEDERISLIARIAEELTLHSTLEELYFYPLLQKYRLDEPFDRSLREHAEVKQLISEILRVKRHDPHLDQLLVRLELLVEQHVSQEESEVFPLMQKRIDGGHLRAVGEEMWKAVGVLRKKELLKMAASPMPPGGVPVPP